MIINPIEKVNALSKLADIVGKKTLVMWCIVATFTSGYFFLKYDSVQDKRISEISAGYERLFKEVKGIKEIQKSNAEMIDSITPRLDTTLNNVQQTLKRLNKR